VTLPLMIWAARNRMRLGWLGLFPISVVNVLMTASVLAFFHE